jgi:ElaB/YqjD/DUF883 family membrane-anchored ribosome-binding protein
MKKFEEIFNLPSLEQLPEEIEEITEDASEERMYEVMAIADKIDAALPQVTGLDGMDSDYDAYAKKAIDAFDDLVELGKNVEDRHAADIFNAASNMLANALNAKTNKANKKIEMIKLQIHNARLEHERDKLEYLKQRHLKVADPEVQETEGHIISTRADILQDILANMQRKSE